MCATPTSETNISNSTLHAYVDKVKETDRALACTHTNAHSIYRGFGSEDGEGHALP